MDGAKPSSRHETIWRCDGFGDAFAAPPLNSAFGGRANSRWHRTWNVRAILADKVLHVAFWCGVPVATLAILLWPARSVLVVGDNPFSLVLNPVQTSLPFPLGELWYFYPATAFGLAVLLVWLVVQRRKHVPADAPSVWLLAFFLPTLVAGIESIKLMQWSMRSHSITAPRPVNDVIIEGASLNALAFFITIVMGGLSARSSGHRSMFWLPVPLAVPAVLASVALPWWLMWLLVS